MSRDTAAKRTLCVQFAVNANFSPEEALEFTRCSFPSVTADEVEAMYKSYAKDMLPSGATKKFYMKGDSTNDSVEAPKRASMGGVPAEVLGEIFKHSTTEDQERLHKTSYGLSRFVDGTFKTYEEIQVFLTDSAIQIAAKEQKPNVVRDGEPTRKRKHSEDEEEQQEKTIPEVLEKLKEIFTLPNVKIGKLNIKYNRGVNEQRIDELYSGIQSIFNNLEKRLHVEEFTITLQTPDSFFPFVNRMKVGPLVEWEIYNQSQSFDQTFSKDKTTQSPHWKNLKSLTVIGFKSHFQLDQLLHIPDVCVELPGVSIEDVVNYRDKLLQIPNKCSHRIMHSGLGDDLLNALKPFTPLKDFSAKGGSNLCDNGRRLYFDLSAVGGFLFSIVSR